MNKQRVLVYNPYRISSVLVAAQLHSMRCDQFDRITTAAGFADLMANDEVDSDVHWVGLVPNDTVIGKYENTVHIVSQQHTAADQPEPHRGFLVQLHSHPLFTYAGQYERFDNMGMETMALLLDNQRAALEYLQSDWTKRLPFRLDDVHNGEMVKRLGTHLGVVKTRVIEKMQTYQSTINGKLYEIPVISADPIMAPWYARRLSFGYDHVVTYDDLGDHVLVELWSKVDTDSYVGDDAMSLVRRHLIEQANYIVTSNTM